MRCSTFLLGLGLTISSLVAATDPFVELHISQSCSDVYNDGLKEYILYTFPQKTKKCITFGAPGYPFVSANPVTQCGDYKAGGAKSGACNNYPLNALSVKAGGGNFKCTFWTSDDCGIENDVDPFTTLTVKKGKKAACMHFPPHLPLADKQSASSMSCVPN